MRKAFALLSIAERVSAEGKSIGIVKDCKDDNELEAVGRIVGV